MFDVCAADEHVAIIERAIRTVKYRYRSFCHSVPYCKFIKLMTIHVVLTAVKQLSAFPSKRGISNPISPAALLEGKGPPDCNIKRIYFGVYAMIYSRQNII